MRKMSALIDAQNASVAGDVPARRSAHGPERRRRRRAGGAQVRRLARRQTQSTWVTISHVRLLDG
jgi:hypothetical protein